VRAQALQRPLKALTVEPRRWSTANWTLSDLAEQVSKQLQAVVTIMVAGPCPQDGGAIRTRR
jgi:hypothetical protein